VRGKTPRQLLAAGAETEKAVLCATLRALAERARRLRAEAREHERAILALVRAWRPDLLARFGVGPIVAAVVLCAWAHPGRVRSAAAFAMLAGTAPVPDCSGQTVRHRLNRCGDRRLNRALHVVIVHRLRLDPTTQGYAARRTAEGKTPKEIRRCLAHFVVRQLFRQLEGPERTHAALDSR
jgi:transposase